MMARLKEALRTGNAVEAAAAAHALKGSVGLFSQGQAYEEARRLEQLGRDGELGEAAAVLELEALSTLMTELRALSSRL